MPRPHRTRRRSALTAVTLLCVLSLLASSTPVPADGSRSGATSGVDAAAPTGGPAAGASSGPSGAPDAAESAAGVRPALADPHPCADVAGFTCAYLDVPLDRQGRVPGRLRLQVAAADNGNARRGTLLFLTGGPGQPGVGLLPRIAQRLSYLRSDYRLVMIDQRGTGKAAIDCPKLQAEVGSSDVTPPSPGAVQECADLLGETRNYYTTADTVADLDDLRAALRVSRWTVDGVSYGAFVAIRYGLTHPGRVSRMVLDSVVPQDGVPTLDADALRRAAEMLRLACGEQNCGYDPAQELATVVRRYGNGVGVFDLLVIASIVDPKLTAANFHPVLTMLHRAAQNDPGPLNAAIDELQGGERTPIEEFSSGLHAATLCADLAELPWDNPAAPLAGREEVLRRAVAALPADHVWPFTPETAAGQGLAQTCLHWPPARSNPRPPVDKLTMPVLLLAGDRDLSTPLAWAQQQATRTPYGELVVVAGMGHSIQGRNPDGDRAVQRFLLGPR